MNSAASSHEGLPARIVLDVRGDEERGYLVVTVGDDDLVRAWLTKVEHPRTGGMVEALAIPLDVERERDETPLRPSSTASEAIGERLGGHAGGTWPEREEDIGRPRIGCLLVGISALFVLTLAYAVAAWLAGGSL